MRRSRTTTIAALVLALLLVPTIAMAGDDMQVTDRAADTVTDIREPDRSFERARARAVHAIERLLRAIDGLQAQISASRFITGEHAGMLRGDLARAEAGLESLVRRIEAAETWEELGRLVDQIDDFAVLTVLAPKTHQVIASDTLVAVAGRLDRFAAKLADILDRLEQAGHDVTEGWRLLEKMDDAIAGGSRLAGPVAEMVIGLGPEDWPDPAQGILADGRADLHAALGSLRSAYATGREIVQFIRGLIDAPMSD
ncbi:MAG TPA: hypothetical protein VK960_01470 [Acidimicrobiia bacterium]|nr:hypothetical protein [Acidimicrobiia bacterium]